MDLCARCALECMAATATCDSDSWAAKKIGTRSPAWLSIPRTGAAMIIPHYVNEIVSDIRCIKPGWYAMDDHGNLSSGPFPSHEECLSGSAQPMNGSIPSKLHPRTK